MDIDEALIIRVQNEQGNPVPGAEPRIMSFPSGGLKAMDQLAFVEPVRRVSSSDGLLRLSLDLLRPSSDRPKRIFVMHHDYVPASVSLVPSQRDYVVNLARGRTLRIKAVLEDGTPLKDIGFRVVPSQPSLSFMTLTQSSGYFIDPRDMETSQVIGSTGADGWMEVPSLQARSYLVAPMDSANAYIPARTQEMVVAQPPFDAVTFTFAIPLALLESVEDDCIRAGMTQDSSIWWTHELDTTTWCLAKKRALEKEYPGSFVSVRMPRPGSEVPKELSLSLRTDHHGWVDTTVSFLPLSEFKRPRMHKVRRRVQPGRFTLIVKDVRGSEIAGAYGFRLTRRSATSSGGDARLTTSQTVEVPPGLYFLRSPLRWPGAKIHEPIRIRAGKVVEHVVQLESRILPLEIRILRPGGGLSSGGSFSFTIDKVASGGMNYAPDLSPVKSLWFWVPEKTRFDYRVRSFGFALLDGTIMTPSADVPAKARVLSLELCR